MIFAALYFYMSSKSVFRTGDISIFVLRGVFFSRYVRLKSTFPDEKNSGEIWDTLVKKLSKINVATLIFDSFFTKLSQSATIRTYILFFKNWR